jgi:hypothetical protein
VVELRICAPARSASKTHFFEVNDEITKCRRPCPTHHVKPDDTEVTCRECLRRAEKV